jgi:putative SOS response-associated peptidase YedK
MRWGFTGFKKKPVINARSETALEKPMFRESMLERRCLVLASAYYEWKKEGNQKTKYRFYFPDTSLLLAGCYRQEQNEPVPRFTILTQEAYPDIEYIHDRMPVIVSANYASDWLKSGFGEKMSAASGLFWEPA